MNQTLCDFCSSSPAMTLQIELDHRWGPLGEPEYRFEYVDICPRCLVERLGRFLQGQTRDVRHAFTEAMMDKKDMAA